MTELQINCFSVPCLFEYIFSSFSFFYLFFNSFLFSKTLPYSFCSVTYFFFCLVSFIHSFIHYRKETKWNNNKKRKKQSKLFQISADIFNGGLPKLLFWANLGACSFFFRRIPRNNLLLFYFFFSGIVKNKPFHFISFSSFFKWIFVWIQCVCACNATLPHSQNSFTDKKKRQKKVKPSH